MMIVDDLGFGFLDSVLGIIPSAVSWINKKLNPEDYKQNK